MPKISEFVVSSAALEASTLLRRLAEPRPVGDRVKTAVGRAARLAGLSYWRAHDLWYGQARRIDATELDAIRRAAGARDKEHLNDLLQLARDYEALAERAARVDPEMVGPWADAMRDVARRARRLADGN